MSWVALPHKSDQPLSFTPGLQPGERQQVYEPRNRFNGLLSEAADNIEVLYQPKSKPLKRLPDHQVRFNTGLKPGVNETLGFSDFRARPNWVKQESSTAGFHSLPLAEIPNADDRKSNAAYNA